MDPARRPALAPHSWSMRERCNENWYRRTVEPDLENEREVWLDHGAYRNQIYDRYIFACLTPYGIANLYETFQQRMTERSIFGDTKRAIKREIQSNIHLSSTLKRRLLKQLVKADVRNRTRGVAAYDSYFAQRITRPAEGDTPEAILSDIESNSTLPQEVKENLIFNLRVCYRCG